MTLYKSKLYMEDFNAAAKKNCGFELVAGKSIAISGGTGMIGSFFVDAIMTRNKEFNQNTDVYILGRNKAKFDERFSVYKDDNRLHFIECDINDKEELLKKVPDKIDFIIHAASNTHPRAYSLDPIGTITANVIGTNNLLLWGKNACCKRFCFLSSVEVYGENKGDTDKFYEDYLGYINCNTVRAGYPESKRLGEALCQAFIAQNDMDVVIPRLSRAYGPTMLMTDTKALSQFILKGVKGEDIVLKSEGTQEYSYSYVADAACAIMYILANGANGEAYNVVSPDSDIMLKDLAGRIADFAGTKVSFELPDEVERAGYSTATKATLDGGKLIELGFTAEYDVERGLSHTISILKEIDKL